MSPTKFEKRLEPDITLWQHAFQHNLTVTITLKGRNSPVSGIVLEWGNYSVTLQRPNGVKVVVFKSAMVTACIKAKAPKDSAPAEESAPTDADRS